MRRGEGKDGHVWAKTYVRVLLALPSTHRDQIMIREAGAQS